MKKLFISSVAFAVSMGAVLPALAYMMPDDFTDPVHREVQAAIKHAAQTQTGRSTKYDVEEYERNRSRATPVVQQAVLQRGLHSNMRNPNLSPDRTYRVLGSMVAVADPDARTIRQESETAFLPPVFVQTGGASEPVRPTRRGIRDGRYF